MGILISWISRGRGQHMPNGRLIRVSKYRGDPKARAFIVATAEPAMAMRLVRNKIGAVGKEIEDLGPVSKDLIKVMSLEPDEVLPIDGMQHVATAATAAATTARGRTDIGRLMCGWPRHARAFFVKARGRLRSCVRPFGAVTYGPLALMDSAGRGLISWSGFKSP
jgi:hypothetical protein